eukprot:6470296-Amphidinium_carterae.1
MSFTRLLSSSQFPRHNRPIAVILHRPRLAGDAFFCMPFFPVPSRGIQSEEIIRLQLEACSPHEVVSDCKGVIKAVQALQTGRRQPNGRNRDLELRVKNALIPGQGIRWIKAHLTQADLDIGRITADDLHGNGQADILANAGIAAHGPLDPEGSWLQWADFANK